MPSISNVSIGVMPAAIPLGATGFKLFGQIAAFKTVSSISMILDSGCAGSLLLTRPYHKQSGYPPSTPSMIYPPLPMLAPRPD